MKPRGGLFWAAGRMFDTPILERSKQLIPPVMPVTSREEEKTAVYLGVTLDLILDAVSLVNPKV